MGLVHYYSRPPSRQKLIAGVTPKWIANSKRSKYLAQIVLSAPPWLTKEDRAEILRLHNQAVLLTKSTGVLHVLDHRTPVNHPRVCGLTVPWNLRVVTWKVNASKGNKWNPDQLEMFGHEG